VTADTWLPTGRLRWVVREDAFCIPINVLQQEFEVHSAVPGPGIVVRINSRAEWRDVPVEEEE